MRTDNEYLQCLGLGLQGLRASGQFCDAMVCVGSTRILVHKVVLSAASKTLHDLALEFDMTPHRERDQLEIVIPPDVSLYAVNMFINYLYTGQLELREQVVSHMERLAGIFGISRLLTHCQEFLQRLSTPDSQNLNLAEDRHQLSHIEPDSSSTNGNHMAKGEEDSNLELNLTRSSSSCSGFSTDSPVGMRNVSVKMEPVHKTSARPKPGTSSTSKTSSLQKTSPASSFSPVTPQKDVKKMTMLKKLMSPIVNLQKLPLNITPDVVVIVSDDENEKDDAGGYFRIRPAHKYSLEEKEAVAIEAKRYGTTHVSRTRNIPLPDVLSWMALFGLRSPGSQKTLKHGKQVNHEADISIVRWIVQQQELNGCVDLNCMKQYALTVYQQTTPKFTASKTWLGNFLQRNMSVLQGTKFVHGDENSSPATESPISVSVKKELVSVEDLAELNRTGELESEQNFIGSLGENTVLEGVSLNEKRMINEALGVGIDGDSDNDNSGFADMDDYEDTQESVANETGSYQMSGASTAHTRAIGTVQTPFGKRPIIVGQAKCFDAKSERKIVQWVLEKNSKDGYVFTDDFKDYARSLYIGSKPFGATQAWMKKFLRRNRALKDVKFCSKFKNTYSNEEKMAAVAMARRFGTGYAAKHTGISHKMIHCWRLAIDRGQLMPATSVLSRIQATSTNSRPLEGADTATDIPGLDKPVGTAEALHGIVPEFEQQIIQEMKEHQAREGSINYEEISKISQAIYKETRPTFKASYSWIKTFLDRHKEETKDIDIDNVSKVIMEEENSESYSSEKISEMVNNALKILEEREKSVGLEDTGTALPSVTGQSANKPADKRPIIVGPSVSFDRKTEKLLVDWAIERQARDGYVFTDDFKDYAKSLHKGSKRFSASSGWMSLFLRRHRNLRHVKWKSKFKNNYTEEEKMAAVAEAKRLGTGHVGRQLGIDPALICAWRIKMEKSAHKQTFWKGTKIRKFGKASKLHQPKFAPIKTSYLSQTDAARGIVPEFEQRIVAKILEEHQKEGSISYEEMSSISQSIYKETRPTFKASYAWIRNFMKRHESELANLNIENVKKVFMPEDDTEGNSIFFIQSNTVGNSEDLGDFQLPSTFQKRPIIVGQSRSLDTKTEKKLVQWLVEQQEKNGYVFLDQFKSYAQSLYKGHKKFAATQAWRVKFLRRNHAAVKHVKFTSSFRNQYSLEEKKAIVLEAKRLGAAHVAKKTGIDHCLINSWRLKLERNGEISVDSPTPSSSQAGHNTWTAKLLAQNENVTPTLKGTATDVGPGLYSHRGIVPKFERKIVIMINEHMDNEGSVTYQDVSNFARAVYKETRPHFKACYNWIKEFIKRHKKELRHVEFEQTRKILLDDGNGTEILIPEDKIDDVERYMPGEISVDSWESYGNGDSVDGSNNPEIVIENAEEEVDPSAYSKSSQGPGTTGSNADIVRLASKKPIIIGMPVHFDRKTEKKLVEWLLVRQERDGFVFTDDLREYARSLYTGPPRKFAATNAWISKFLRRNKLGKKIEFQSRLKGNNPKFEEKIVQLILEQQQKEGSVSNDDIQRITQSVYKEIRPNFRACYNWIKDFIKRHKEELVEVELENVKKVFIPDDDEKDGVLIRDYDPLKGLTLLDTSSEYRGQAHMEGFNEESIGDSSWMDLDSSQNLSMSGTCFTEDQPSSSVLSNLVSKKRPIIIAPPKTMDIKTEKRLVQWMVEQQEQHGCVYLDLFKDYAKSIHTGPKKFAATQAWMVRFKQRNHQALKKIVIKSRFRNEYTLEEKIAAVEEARRLGCNHVGRKLGINGGVIYSWKVQIEQAERLGGAQGFGTELDTEKESSRGMVPEFEERIVELVLETQAAKNGVSYDDISRHARSVYCETRPHFKASNNWVLEFIRKNRDRFEGVNFENQRKVLTDEEKLHILSEEKKYGTEHVTKKRNISASTIYHWKRNMIAKAIPIPKYKALVGNKIKQKYAKGKKVQKSFTEADKRKVVAEAEENGITHASLKLGISRNMIAKWVKYFRDRGENIVINFTPASTVKKELEQKIVAWVLEQNDELGIVMTNRIQEYAKKVFEEAYTNFTATEYWLEVFISQNAEKFENVRFREKGDTDLEFTDEIKLKLSKYSEKYGAVETANKTGLAPKNIYHWRRCFRQKGYDLSSGSTTPTLENERADSEEPKSLMQQKLDRIEQKYTADAKKSLVVEASTAGASATGSKHKIPLPLLLKWMKMYPDGEEPDVKPDISLPGPRTSFFTKCVSSKESTPDSVGYGKLKVRLPSVERTKSVSSMRRYSDSFKKETCIEAKKSGALGTARKHGIPKTTLYAWIRDFAGAEECKSVERSRSSVDSSHSSFDSELDLSTPIRVQDIKKEPGTFSEVLEDSSVYSRVVRKYSEEEKLEVANRALEIGYKPASREMDIPISNVRRWTEMLKKKIKHPEISGQKKNKRQEQRLSSSLNESSFGNISEISFGDISDKEESGEESSASFSEASDISKTSQTGLKRSSDMMGPSPFTSAKQRRFNRYSDAEKLEFVLHSDVHGSRAAAEKAGVSIDLLYKWRQKFSSRSRSLASSSSPANTSVCASDEISPSASSPGSTNANTETSQSNFRDENRIVSEGAEFHIEHNTDEDSNDHMSFQEENSVSVNDPDLNLSEDISINTQETLNDQSENLIHSNFDNMSEIQPILQLEESAASKVLEMTTDYIEAEMEHEKNQTNSQKMFSFCKNNSGSASEGEEEKADKHTQLGMIQIVNVKSEAPD